MKNYPQIFVSGSLAFDRILDFPGRFDEHILPDKIHTINLSFNIPHISEQFGGNAGNIAYSLALLNVPSAIIGSGGNDFENYRERLRSMGIGIAHIKVNPARRTASAYIITDRRDNQITGFHVGAMDTPVGLPPVADIEQVEYAIIAPEHPANMVALAQLYARGKCRYFFDPGQAMNGLTPRQLRECIAHAYGLMANDYEMSWIQRKSGWSLKKLQHQCAYVVETRGAEGSVIWHGGKRHQIKPARVKKVVDPTGAGDAYRAGFIAALSAGLSTVQAGQLASVVAAYAVEHHGTQRHVFNRKLVADRYYGSFGEKIGDEKWKKAS